MEALVKTSLSFMGSITNAHDWTREVMHKRLRIRAGSENVLESQGSQNLSDVSPATLGCRRAPSHEQLEGRQLLGKQSWGHGYNAIPVDCKPSRLCIEVCRYPFIIPNEMHQSLRTYPNLGSPTEKNRLRFQPDLEPNFVVISVITQLTRGGTHFWLNLSPSTRPHASSASRLFPQASDRLLLVQANVSKLCPSSETLMIVPSLTPV